MKQRNNSGKNWRDMLLTEGFSSSLDTATATSLSTRRPLTGDDSSFKCAPLWVIASRRRHRCCPYRRCWGPVLVHAAPGSVLVRLGKQPAFRQNGGLPTIDLNGTPILKNRMAPVLRCFVKRNNSFRPTNRKWMELHTIPSHLIKVFDRLIRANLHQPQI